MQTIQKLAATVLEQVLGGRNLTQALSETFERHSALSFQQHGAIQDIAYGTLRRYGQLANVLEQLLDKPLHDAKLRYLLLVALYQLQHSKAAEYAVVDYAVRGARRINRHAGGLVNAVLRNFLRRRDHLFSVANQTSAGRYSYPSWWIEALELQYPRQAMDILAAGNLHPPMTLRVNSRQSSVSDYLARLKTEGIAATALASPQAVMLERPLGVDKLPGFSEGVVSVQDAGAQQAACFLDVGDGMRVLDACAAPGGKTAHLLELAEVELTALDADARRLERVNENLSRLKLNATLVHGDAANPGEWWDGQLFDRILADVPCSASGVVKRHPDIKWLRRAQDIEGFSKQQRAILEALWPLLKRGGKLLYATCSVFSQENREIVEAFLADTQDARAFPLAAPEMNQGQFLPTAYHDGFYYALLSKAL